MSQTSPSNTHEITSLLEEALRLSNLNESYVAENARSFQFMNGLHNDQNVTDDIQNINFYPRLIEIENILDEIKNSYHDLKTENTKLRIRIRCCLV